MSVVLVSESTTLALRMKQMDEAMSKIEQLDTNFAQTGTMNMLDAEAVTEVTTLINAWANAEVEAKAQFFDKIKAFFNKWILPAFWIAVSLIALNSLNPWLSTFIKDWHKDHPGTCFNPYSGAPSNR